VALTAKNPEHTHHSFIRDYTFNNVQFGIMDTKVSEWRYRRIGYAVSIMQSKSFSRNALFNMLPATKYPLTRCINQSLNNDPILIREVNPDERAELKKLRNYGEYDFGIDANEETINKLLN